MGGKFNLSDDRSHKVQYIDLITGNFYEDVP